MGAHSARERVIADSQFGAGAIAGVAPATWFLGLSTTPPNDDGSGFTEPIGSSYARVAITNNATNFPAAATVGGVTTKTNGTKFTFPNPTGTWGLIAYFGFFTASSGGTPEFSNQMDTAITVKNGNTPVEFDIATLPMTWQ